MDIINNFILILDMLAHFIIEMRTMFKKIIFQRQFIPHAIDDILNVILVATYCVCYGDMLVIGYKLGNKSYDT